MKLKPFAELIALSKEKLDEAMAPIRMRQVKSKAELEMSKLDGDLLQAEIRVQEMCAAMDINFPALMDQLDRIGLMERRKKQYTDVLQQLFPG